MNDFESPAASSRGRPSATIGISLTVASVLVLVFFVAQPWILDRYYLYRLQRASTLEEQGKWIDILFERRCVAAVPHILRHWKSRGEVRLDEGLMNSLAWLGPRAVPYLARALGGKDSDDRFILCTLERLGPDSRPALPVIVRYLQERGDRASRSVLWAAGCAIAAMGECAADAGPDLARLPPEVVKLSGGRIYLALGRIRARGPEVVAMLENAIGMETGEIRVLAAEALWLVDPGHPRVIPCLVECLRDERRFARADAAIALGRIGESAREAVPALIELIRSDPENAVRLASGQALDMIGSAEGFWVAVELARGTTKSSRLAGAIALGGFHSRASEAVPILLELANEEDEDIASDGLYSLWYLGPAAEPAIPELVRICQTAKSRERIVDAAKALGAIGKASPEVISTLVSRLPLEADDGGRFTIAEAFCSLAEKDSSLVPSVIAALDGDRETAIGAIETLYLIGAAAAPALEKLESMLRTTRDKTVASDLEEAIRRISKCAAAEKLRQSMTKRGSAR